MTCLTDSFVGRWKDRPFNNIPHEVFRHVFFSVRMLLQLMIFLQNGCYTKVLTLFRPSLLLPQTRMHYHFAHRQRHPRVGGRTGGRVDGVRA